jgi:hypothetical protein
VRWTSDAAAAFRHGVQSLEDHLLGLGVDEAELDVRVEGVAGGEAALHAVLKVGPDRMDSNAEEIDLPYGLTQVLEQLREVASVDRLFDDGRGPVTGADAPWEDILETVVAMATHLVARAVDTGDLAPGSVDPRDLADDALVTVLEAQDRSMRAVRAVRASLARELEKRILGEGDRQDDVDLDAVIPGEARSMHDPDDVYGFGEPDEAPMREQDILDPAGDLADEDLVPPAPDAEPETEEEEV